MTRPTACNRQAAGITPPSTLPPGVFRPPPSQLGQPLLAVCTCTTTAGSALLVAFIYHACQPSFIRTRISFGLLSPAIPMPALCPALPCHAVPTYQVQPRIWAPCTTPPVPPAQPHPTLWASDPPAALPTHCINCLPAWCSGKQSPLPCCSQCTSLPCIYLPSSSRSLHCQPCCSVALHCHLGTEHVYTMCKPRLLHACRGDAVQCCR